MFIKNGNLNHLSKVLLVVNMRFTFNPQVSTNLEPMKTV